MAPPGGDIANNPATEHLQGMRPSHDRYCRGHAPFTHSGSNFLMSPESITADRIYAGLHGDPSCQ